MAGTEVTKGIVDTILDAASMDRLDLCIAWTRIKLVFLPYSSVLACILFYLFTLYSV